MAAVVSFFMSMVAVTVSTCTTESTKVMFTAVAASVSPASLSSAEMTSRLATAVIVLASMFSATMVVLVSTFESTVLAYISMVTTVPSVHMLVVVATSFGFIMAVSYSVLVAAFPDPCWRQGGIQVPN